VFCGGGRELLEAVCTAYWPFVKGQIQAVRKDSGRDSIANVEDTERGFKQVTGQGPF